MLPHEEVVSIALRMRDLDPNSEAYRKCVAKIVEHNLRLVISYVHKFVTKKTLYAWGSPQSLDMLQAGSLGLIRAAEKYDPDTGWKFSTYAMPWISSKVGRVRMKESSIFNISEESIRRVYYYAKHERPVTLKNGRSPTIEETQRLADAVYSAQYPLSIEYVHSTESDSGICLSNFVGKSYSINEFDEGCFQHEIEDAMAAAQLSQEQIFMFRQMFIEEKDSKEICELLDLSAKQLEDLKADAISRLKPVLGAL